MQYRNLMILGTLLMIGVGNQLGAQTSEPLPATTLVNSLGPGWIHTITITDAQKATIQAVLEKYDGQAVQVRLAPIAMAYMSIAQAQYAKLATLTKKWT